MPDDTFEKIARDLAGLPEPMDTEWTVCVLCSVDDGEPHKGECPWARARVLLGLPVKYLARRF